jgi:hypothetical protein
LGYFSNVFKKSINQVQQRFQDFENSHLLIQQIISPLKGKWPQGCAPFFGLLVENIYFVMPQQHSLGVFHHLMK